MALPLIGTLFTAGMALVDKFYPDENSKAEAKMKLLQLQQEGNVKELEAELAKMQAIAQVDMAQINVNSIEAASGSAFARNWRPALGWTCTMGFCTNFLLIPLMNFGSNVYNSVAANLPIAMMQPLDLEDAGMMLGTLIGMASLRTFEKIKRRPLA